MMEAAGQAFESSLLRDFQAVSRSRPGANNALDAPTVWRYSVKNALNHPEVPAVDAFHKLIVEAEKQQASNP
jgi:hypothetical protein